MSPMGFGRREDAVGAAVGGRCADQLKFSSTIEDPEHVEVRKALNVCEAEIKLGKDFNDAFGFVLRAEAARYGGCVLVGSPDETNRLRREHDGASC